MFLPMPPNVLSALLIGCSDHTRKSFLHEYLWALNDTFTHFKLILLFTIDRRLQRRITRTLKLLDFIQQIWIASQLEFVHF